MQKSFVVFVVFVILFLFRGGISSIIGGNNIECRMGTVVSKNYFKSFDIVIFCFMNSFDSRSWRYFLLYYFLNITDLKWICFKQI